MTADSILITQHQADATLSAQQKLLRIAEAVEHIRQLSSQAAVDAVQLKDRTASPAATIIEHYRHGAADGRTVAYCRAAQIIERILQEPR